MASRRKPRHKAKPPAEDLEAMNGRRSMRFPEQWDRISLEQRQLEEDRARCLIASGYGSIDWSDDRPN